VDEQRHPVAEQAPVDVVEEDVHYYNDEKDENENDDDGLCSYNHRVHYPCSLVRVDHNTNDDDGCSRCCCCCCCCCTDTRDQPTSSSSHSPDTTSSHHRAPRDVCSNIWTCLAAASCCCGSWLRCWWNCCGVCATAQEARELQRRLPPRYLYIDYITFEPWLHYYPQIQALRRQRPQRESFSSSFWQHLQATSELSQLLLKILSVTLVILLLASVLHWVHDFNYEKVLVICATLLQAVLVLYFCHWQDHKLDLSLDAVIKLFAAGFCFATVFSMILEQVLTAVGINVLGLTLGILNANQQAAASHDKGDTGHNAHANSDSSTTASDNSNDSSTFVDPRDYQDEPSPEKFFFALVQQYPFAYIVYLFFSAYIVAGTVEETAKYFCYWMVEHPDFVYDDDDSNMEDAKAPEQQPEAPLPPLLQQQLQSANGVVATIAASTESNETQPLVVASSTTTAAKQQYGTTLAPSSSSSSSSSTLPPPPPQQLLVFEPVGTFRSRAAAITVAMIATACGFACLENLIYVFGTGFGTSLKGGTFFYACFVLRNLLL
jgi:hypothetical protein